MGTIIEEWKKTQFDQIDASSIAKLAEKYAKICKRLEGAIDLNPLNKSLNSSSNSLKLKCKLSWH